MLQLPTLGLVVPYSTDGTIAAASAASKGIQRRHRTLSHHLGIRAFHYFHLHAQNECDFALISCLSRLRRGYFRERIERLALVITLRRRTCRR